MLKKIKKVFDKYKLPNLLQSKNWSDPTVDDYTNTSQNTIKSNHVTIHQARNPYAHYSFICFSADFHSSTKMLESLLPLHRNLLAFPCLARICLCAFGAFGTSESLSSKLLLKTGFADGVLNRKCVFLATKDASLINLDTKRLCFKSQCLNFVRILTTISWGNDSRKFDSSIPWINPSFNLFNFGSFLPFEITCRLLPDLCIPLSSSVVLPFSNPFAIYDKQIRTKNSLTPFTVPSYHCGNERGKGW